MTEHTTGLKCEGCGKPVRRGHFVNVYDDAGEVHADCESPYRRPLNPTVDDETSQTLPTYVLLGDPLSLFLLSAEHIVAEAAKAA